MTDRPTAYARAITTPLGKNKEHMFQLTDHWLWPQRSSVIYDPELTVKADDALCLSISGKMEGE